MCLAVPGRVVSIRNDKAVVDFGEVRKEADVSLLDSVKVGDYVLVHVGFAIQKIDRKKAEDSLDAISGMEL